VEKNLDRECTCEDQNPLLGGCNVKLRYLLTLWDMSVFTISMVKPMAENVTSSAVSRPSLRGDDDFAW
jgi:hypothetical protein